MKKFLLWLLFLIAPTLLPALVQTGVDRLFEPEYFNKLQGKKIALVTNQTAIDSDGVSTLEKIKAKSGPYKLVKLFAPEHGIKGQGWASEAILDDKDESGIPILSLHGKTRRPTQEMLKGVDLILFDIQDIGSRSYTFATTLFYVMEEAAKHGIEVAVLDRPNPLSGNMIDGPMMEDKWRSFVGYLNVPYCHGMTIGELALFFNHEYQIGCKLFVVPMKGWKRSMTFKDTGLSWIPTSPNVPDAETPLYYPATGILGELGLVSIGVGYTLPFKVIGAPWIEAEKLTAKLRQEKIPGVLFRPFYFRPFSGKFSHQNLEGVLITVTDPSKFKPVTTQYRIIDALKTLYPAQVKEALKSVSQSQKAMFSKVNGTEKIWTQLLSKDGKTAGISLSTPERKRFEEKRKKYLLY